MATCFSLRVIDYTISVTAVAWHAPPCYAEVQEETVSRALQVPTPQTRNPQLIPIQLATTLQISENN